MPAVSLGSLALVAAAVIAAELLHRRDDDLGAENAFTDRFSAAAAVSVVAALILGPLPAGFVTGLAILGVRRLSGDPWRESVVRGAAVGGAAFAAGVAYLLASAAEVTLGAALAIAADSNLWYAALLVPVLVLLERLYWRLAGVRREVAAALETFANIVDERDRSTHGHSLRIAEYVRELADSLGLPHGDVRRLWWAGRLHDLGKVAVDAAVLGKPTRLNAEEWAAVTRAPRLSARLLQRFRFAAHQAKAVEYHRERLDGSGYYGARGSDIPLAAHFLIVADSFDAMTSDRPFRRRLTPEEALAEIEANAGTQFHPAIAKAFVAVQRGTSPTDVLDEAELDTIRDSSMPVAAHPAPGDLRRHPELLVALGATLGLLGLGIGILELFVAGVVAGAVGAKMWLSTRVRARRLAGALAEAASAGGDRAALFGRTADAFEDSWALEFALLVSWEEDGTGGTVELQRGESSTPRSELTSWLLREAESGQELIVDDGVQLGRDGVSLALPLRRENSALVGFLVLGGLDRPAAHVVVASRASLNRLGLALADAPPTPAQPKRRLAAAT